MKTIDASRTKAGASMMNEGGSGLSPLFAEASTVARPSGTGTGGALTAAFVAGVVLGVAAARRLF